MSAALLFVLIGVGFTLIVSVGGMIKDYQMRKHGLVRGATQKQLQELTATLRAMDERLDRMEEHMADQVLDARRPDQLSRAE